MFILRKKKAQRPKLPPVSVHAGWQLEEELPDELHHARIARARDLSELRVRIACVDVVELRVIEGIEGCETDFEVRPFMRRERDALEQRDVPIEEPGIPRLNCAEAGLG
jgi:hypothetical protein